VHVSSSVVSIITCSRKKNGSTSFSLFCFLRCLLLSHINRYFWLIILAFCDLRPLSLSTSQIQNIWDTRADVFFMYQVAKTGKQLAEPAGDQGEASAGWTAGQEKMKAGDAAPSSPSGGGGFGEVGGGGFGAKKEVSSEEAELLKMLKGFGSTTHEGGGDDSAPPAAAAAPPKEAPKKPPAPKPKPPAPKPKAAPPPTAAAASLPSASGDGGGGGGGDGEMLPVQKPVAGGTFWKCLSAIRARDEASASGEVVGEMSKGDYCHVLSQEGDWCKVSFFF